MNSGEGLEGNGKALDLGDQGQGREGEVADGPQGEQMTWRWQIHLVNNFLPMALFKWEDRKYEQVLRGYKSSEC